MAPAVLPPLKFHPMQCDYAILPAYGTYPPWDYAHFQPGVVEQDQDHTNEHIFSGLCNFSALSRDLDKIKVPDQGLYSLYVNAI